jgi:DNA-binding Lrp family transcriptional regulator
LIIELEGTHPMGRRPADIDEIDRQLCELVAAEPRARRRELTRAVGVTDETVATRLRNLRQHNVITTTVVVDWKAAGYSAGAMLRIVINKDDLSATCRALLRHGNVAHASITTGCGDIVRAMLAINLVDL